MFAGMKLICLLLLMLPIVSITKQGFVSVMAESDIEDEIVEDEDVVSDDDITPGDVETIVDGGEDEVKVKGSPDADTIILFTSPSIPVPDLPAGKLVEFLVGFTNKGNKDFILESIDASFRYPMDFSYYIQNFTAISYNQAIKPKQETTLAYSFYPAEAFAGRPLGLTVNLAYRDTDGNSFIDPVFNQTVNVVEVDEGLDGETFFLYIFMLAFAVLLLVVGHHFLSSFGRRRGGKKAVVEVGTTNRNDVDYDWIPKETLNEIKKTPRQSPRQRKTNREANSH